MLLGTLFCPFLCSANLYVGGILAVVQQCYTLELLLNASALLLGAPPLPLIVCDL